MIHYHSVSEAQNISGLTALFVPNQLYQSSWAEQDGREQNLFLVFICSWHFHFMSKGLYSLREGEKQIFEEGLILSNENYC